MRYVSGVQALQDLRWAFSEPSTAIHPRAYNLSQEADFQAFEADFRWTAAAAVLRTALRDGGYHPARVPCEAVLQLALTVCRGRLEFVGCGAILHNARETLYCVFWHSAMPLCAGI